MKGVLVLHMKEVLLESPKGARQLAACSGREKGE